MKTVRVLVIFALLLGLPSVVLATPIATAYTDTVTGWEWAELNGTTGLTWNQVAGVCATDGVTACSADLGAVEFTGWIWATRDQVRDLFVNATDLTAAQMADYFEGQIDSTWAPQFLSEFTTTGNNLLGYPTVGGLSSSSFSSTFTYDISMSNAPSGVFDTASLLGTLSKNFSDPTYGVWLHRQATTSVPEPATIVLLGVGLLGFAGRHLLRQKNF